MSRCEWAGSDPLMRAYHDTEWGVPLHDERRHFEMITLEGAQAGLSWQTILNKREGYRRLFEGFDAERVARFGERDVERLMGDAAIVRNRMKIESTIDNARALLALQETEGSFDSYIWAFVGGQADREPVRVAPGPAGADRSLQGDEQGPQASGFPLRGPHDGVRVHAGGGTGK